MKKAMMKSLEFIYILYYIIKKFIIDLVVTILGLSSSAVKLSKEMRNLNEMFDIL